MNDLTAHLLSTLKKSELNILFRNGQERACAKNTLIIEEGDRTNCAYIINSGKVKIFLSDKQGREIVLSVLEAGDYFGEMALIDSKNRSAAAMSLEDTELTTINQNNFRECLQFRPDIAERIMLGLVTRLREADEKISSLALMGVHERVANMLLGLAKDQNGLLVVEEKPTHRHIANVVGASREMVTRILKRMVADGQIRIAGRRIVILNRTL